MAYRSLGRDSVNSNTKPVEGKERERKGNAFQLVLEPDFLTHLKEVAKDRQTSVSQMLRYVMAVETGYKASKEGVSQSHSYL